MDQISSNIYKLIEDDGSTIDFLLNNKKLYSLISNSFAANNSFKLGKYDLTIIKSCFGENNRFEINSFREMLNEKYVSEDKRENEFSMITNRINKLVEQGLIENNEEVFSFTEEALDNLSNIDTSFSFTSYDANVICGYIDHADGLLTEKDLIRFLENEYKDETELKSQFNYLIKRVGKNIDSGYIEKVIHNNTYAYKLTEEGLNKKEEILFPEKNRLKEAIKNMTDKGILQNRDNLLYINNDYKFLDNELLKNIKEEGVDVTDIQKNIEIFTNDLLDSMNNQDVSFDRAKTFLNLKEIEDPIQKSRDNAYNDIKERISQVILKGAVESMHDNVFYVDQKLSVTAVNFIKNLNSSVNLIPEQTQVVYEAAHVLLKVFKDDEQVLNFLKSFSEKEGLLLQDKNINNIMVNARESLLLSQDINIITTSNIIDKYLVSLKITGATEQFSFNAVSDLIDSDSLTLRDALDELKDNDLLFYSGDGKYSLTQNGVTETLKTKDLDPAEREIMKVLDEENGTLDFNNLLLNKNVFTLLRDKDPDEFKLRKFDTTVRSFFGESNKITLVDLEKSIYDNYTDEQHQTNTEKAEKEYGYLKYRIEKLALNGFVSLDKNTGAYSFTNKVNSYFEYSDEKALFQYTKEALDILGISEKMEFTKYDASHTLGYVDSTDQGILTKEELRSVLLNEIANKSADRCFVAFDKLLGSEYEDVVKKYLLVDDDGLIKSTDEGKWLGIGIKQVEKFIKNDGELEIKRLIESGDNPVELKKLLDLSKKTDEFIKKGVFLKDSKLNDIFLNPIYKDINNFLYQIYKNGGVIDKSLLKDVLEKNVRNDDAEKQYKYLTWRLDNLKEQGYLSGDEGTYSITTEGIEKRADILVQQRKWLKSTIEYLNKLGLIETHEGNISATPQYYNYVKNIEDAKVLGVPRVPGLIRPDVAKLIDRALGNVDVEKIKRTNQRISNGKFLNGDYNEIKTLYDDVRSLCNVKDIHSKTVNNLSTTLLVAGVSLEETKVILSNWNIRTNNIHPDKLNEIIDKTYETVKENNLWGKVTVISSKDWKEMFKSLNIDENNMPKWMYKGVNWQSKSFLKRNFGVSAIGDIWKKTWGEIERQRMQTEAQADFMKKQLDKQQSVSQSKEARNEQLRKEKSKTLYQDDELET